MYLLDTNIVSMLEPRRQSQAPDLMEWLETNGAGLYLSVLTITELDAGAIKLKREGKVKRADQIEALITSVLTTFADRVLTVDLDTARHIARLSQSTYQQPVALPDVIIAATAVRNGLIVLTHNLRDFIRLGVPAHDPFVSLPSNI